TWMAFGGNTRDLGSFGEETDKTTTLHQILEEVVHTECGDGVASFKRQRQDGKENGVNILKSIDEGPFQMGTFHETLAEGNEGALRLGPKRARVYFDLSPEDKERYNADIRSNKISYFKGAASNGGVQNRARNANPGQARQIKCHNCNGSHDTAADEDVYESPVQDLALNVDNMFQADECDAFDSDVDEAPTTQTMFIANLSSADPVYDEAIPSYDSNILSEMHHDVQPNCVVDSNADYTSDSNMISYDEYVKDNTKLVVQSNVSSVPNDAYKMIINEMYEQTAQSVSANKQNKVVNASLTAELTTYKEQVELYERRAKFELTEREQKIKEQLRIVITDRNIKEENLKKELHSVKMQLNSTINHNKSMVEEVTSLKKDFKQKENKHLEEFLDMKALKEKVEDKLYKQDQSFQTVHMLCKPKPYYDEQKKVAIGYKNPLCLTRPKQVQLASINGHEISNQSCPDYMQPTQSYPRDKLKLLERKE
ncbi:hypothetical protein Tco_0667426, partial [Tanacetum coccineum]